MHAIQNRVCKNMYGANHGRPCVRDFRRVVLFKDHSPGFEVGHCGLDIGSVPCHLSMGSAGSSSGGKDQKPGPFTTTVKETIWSFAFWGQSQLVGVEALGAVQIGCWQRGVDGIIG